MKIFKGNILIIDDGIGKEGDKINEVIKAFSIENYCITARSLLEIEKIDLTNIALIIVDWNFGETEFDMGVQFGSVKKETNQEAVLAFIKKVQDERFIPIFVFTNEKNTAQQSLEKANLLGDMSIIDIVDKTELLSTKAIEDKIEQLFADRKLVEFYIEWTANLSQSQNELFKELKGIGLNWIKTIYESFLQDQGENSNPNQSSREVQEFLNNVLVNKIEPFDFDFSTDVKESASKEQIRKIFGAMMTAKPIEKLMCGDVFKDENTGYYYINIRPQCDLERIDNPKLLLIKGKKYESKVNSCLEDSPIIWHKGAFIDYTNTCTVAFIDEKVVKFELNDMQFGEVETCDWLKNASKICRLLPPYITKVQKSFAQYNTRESLIRIPEQSVKIKELSCKAKSCGSQGCKNFKQD